MRTPPNECVSADIADVPKARKASEPARSCPERRCVLSGENAPRDALVRLAISPAKADGTSDVLPDPAAKAPGRGAWIGVSRAELESAVAKGQMRSALARAFKGAKLNVPDNLPQLVEAALTRSFADRLGLEMRAGNIVLGSDRIAEQARSGRVALLLHAADASEDGRKKLDQAWRVGREEEGSGGRGAVLPLDRAALSVALGRDNVVHLALSSSAAAGRVQGALARLLHYMGVDRPASDIGESASAGRPDEQLNM